MNVAPDEPWVADWGASPTMDSVAGQLPTALGTGLRSLYEGLIRESVPDEFRTVLDRLDSRHECGRVEAGYSVIDEIEPGSASPTRSR